MEGMVSIAIIIVVSIRRHVVIIFNVYFSLNNDK